MSPFRILIAFCFAAALNIGCQCGGATQQGCRLDDDCRALSCPTGEIPACMDGACGCNSDLPLGDVGRFETLALRGGTAYVAAYNNTYGDLMVGHAAPPGRVTDWEFVDGVPFDGIPDNPLSQVRGGISDKGDDVGRYTSIAINSYGDPVIAYYDLTNHSLKFATFGAVQWHTQVVDKGAKIASGDNVGMYASLTLAKDGSPGIAYYAEVAKGPSGMREGQLRFAQAMRPVPTGPTDWHVTVIETRPIPAADPANPPALPEGIALFISSARKPDGAPVIAYYDRVRGNLRFVEYDTASKAFLPPVILDGEDAMGGDTGDVGEYPSVATDKDGISHISYVDATRDGLLYVNTKTKTPEVADDGYRPKDETTLDGLPAPVYHLVGDSSSIQLVDSTVYIAYGDSTVLQLRLATRDGMKNTWKTEAIAGHGSPFNGSYGFYAQCRVVGGSVVMSSYAINQHKENPDFYVETFGVSLGLIQ